jgi:hypothetical protein
VLPITPTLLLAATNYQIRFKTSVAGTVTLYRNATAGNWSRQLRTTTAAAPGAGDKLIIAGEHTGSGTGNDFTVTMDSTASTIYGSAAFSQSITVNKRSTLSYGTAASTAYHLKLAGIIKVWQNGVFNIGTVVTPIPPTSTAKLEFSVVTNVDSGLEIGSGGTFTAQGPNLHTTTRALLNANLSAAGTVLTTDVSTGWKSGDQIAIASTTRALTEAESRTLSVDASGTTVTVSSGVTYAHSGTSPTQAEVINLTRSIKIFGTSASLCAYVLTSDTSIIDCDYVEFYYLGSATALKHGIELRNSTGSAEFHYCALHDYYNGLSAGVGFYQAVTSFNNVTIASCNFWATNYIAIYFTAASTASPLNVTIDDNWSLGGVTGTTYGIISLIPNMTTTNNRMSGCSNPFQFNSAAGGKLGTFSGNVCHSTTAGFSLTGVFDGTASNLVAWRTNGQALSFTNNTRLVLDGFTTFGNATGAITIQDNKDCVIKNIVSNSDAGFGQPYGVYIPGPNDGCVIYNSTFGATTGHTTADIVTTAIVNDIIFENCTFSSATEFSVSTWKLGGEYFSHNHQNIAGNIKRVAWEGNRTRDTAIYNTASPSSRLAPAQTTVKLRSAYWKAAVLSGNTITPIVYVRKSTAGDGTAYNGNQPRLLVKANPVAGIASDTVLATMTVAAGTWEALTGTTAAVTENTVLEFFVDCDGTQGWVNVDDVQLTNADSSGMDIWFAGSSWVTGAGPIANFTDVPVDKVELGYAYKYNSSSNNRTGTRRQPALGEVKIGTLYGPSDTLTGTYDGSDRWTDPSDANVRLGVAYKANSVTNNKTGRITVPVAADVKHGVAFETDAGTTGTYRGYDLWSDPSDANVRLGTGYLADGVSKTGRVRVPTAVQVQAGVVFDTDDTVTGTYGESTPPTFAGISGLTANPDGSLSASWSAASDTTPPIVYKVYIQANTATGLFSTTPFATYATNLKMFTLPSGANLVSGTTYYVGVRATDAFNNSETNSVSMSATSTGVEEGVLIYDAHAAFSISNANELQISMWLTANGQPVLSSLGAASYTVYDKDDIAVGGMTESGIAANGNGVFVSTPISANPLDSFSHYRVEVTIVHQSQPYIASRGLTIFE